MDANSVLNDESRNDYQLIKELSEYIKNHYNKGLNIDKKFFQDILDIVLRNSEIEFNGIVFINNKKTIAHYSPYFKTLNFNITSIKKGAQAINKVWYMDKIDKRIIEYYYSLYVIIHELTHARQYYLLSHEQNEIYKSCNELITYNIEVYNGFHDNVLIERYATLRGYILAYEVLSYIFPFKKIEELRDMITSFLMYGYGIVDNNQVFNVKSNILIDENTQLISAVEVYNEIIASCELDGVSIPEEKMSLYDRFYLGLPISNEEYLKIREIFINLENEKGNIRQLVSRL